MRDYQSYKVETAAGLTPGVAVVAGTNVGGCALPGAANAAGFLGFTSDAAALGQSIPVVRGTRCRAIAAGAITHGHWVNIADNTGKVQDCQTVVDSAPGAASVTNVIGKAENGATNSGDVVFVTVIEFAAKTAVT